MKKGNSNNYFAYLVRFWRENDQGGWRVTVEDPHTQDKKNFANPDAYLRYLETILNHPANEQSNHESNEKSS
jgi:subtilisin-like proprotein convertase family protein